MDITVNLAPFFEAASNNPLSAGWFILAHGGWIPFLFIMVSTLWYVRLRNIRERYLHRLTYTLLAIDVPKLNEQSTRAVEQIFAQVSGALSGANVIEKYIQGKNQESFSFEIVSLGGYIQFLVRTPSFFRDLIEAAIYAQYPNAEITEVEDYTGMIPRQYPSEEFNLWGTELKLARKNVYPIRTYPQFEHTLTQKFADPMAALLEIMSHVHSGENLWIQWVVTPIGDGWKEEGVREAKKLIGAHVPHTPTLAERALKPVRTLTSETSEVFLHGLGISPFSAGGAETGELPSQIQYLSPGERAVVEAIETKISKVGFHTKCRIIYVAKKELFDKARGVVGILGALSQFSALNLNSFEPVGKVTTKANYVFINKRIAKRQRKIVRAFRERSKELGWGHGMILNTEELATVWHFPVVDVKAPLVKTTEAKRGEPPVELPIEVMEPPTAGVSVSSVQEAAAPENLPV
ncbi:MAG: hypothetical protein AB1352_03645 [Patescibacteria group bacterium]